MTIETARKIFKKNFIGPDELDACTTKLHCVKIPRGRSIVSIPLTEAAARKFAKDYILIYGTSHDADGKPLTINRFWELFGTDPVKSEPCMYNQDWYIREPFARDAHLDRMWYLVKKEINSKSRGRDPRDLLKSVPARQSFPSAILLTYTFFAYYFHTGGKILWEHDFVWCGDTDSNADRIYVGRYHDPRGINKAGFNIHRHLSIKKNYGCAPALTLTV